MSLAPPAFDRVSHLLETLRKHGRAATPLPASATADLANVWRAPDIYLASHVETLGAREIEFDDPRFANYAILDALIDHRQIVMIPDEAEMDDVGEMLEETFGLVPEEVAEVKEDEEDELDFPPGLLGWIEAYEELDARLLFWKFPDDEGVTYVSLADAKAWPEITVAARGLDIEVVGELADLDPARDPSFIRAVEDACAREKDSFRILPDEPADDEPSLSVATIEFTAPVKNGPAVIQALVRTFTAEENANLVDQAVMATEARFRGFAQALENEDEDFEDRYSAALKFYEQRRDEAKLPPELVPVLGITLDEFVRDALYIDVIVDAPELDRAILRKVVEDFRKVSPGLTLPEE